MSKILKVALAIVLFLPVYSLAEAQTPEDIPLGELFPPGNNPHSPSVVPITGYVFPYSGDVALYSSSYSGNALVLLENLTTGAYSMNEVYISSSLATIPLLGQGNYSITITLSFGTTYQGSFIFTNQ